MLDGISLLITNGSFWTKVQKVHVNVQIMVCTLVKIIVKMNSETDVKENI